MSIEAIDAVLKESKSTHGARLVALSLANHADTYGRNAHPGLKLIMDESKLSRAAVYGAVTELQQLKEIRSVGKKGRATIWEIDLPSLVQKRDATVQNLDASVSESGLVTVKEPSKEPPPVTAPVPVEDVWAHYVTVMKPRRAELDSDARKIINDALKVATPAELQTCIDACQASDYHMKRGEHANRSGPKYSALGKILKHRPRLGETQRSRIDFWLDQAQEQPESEEAFLAAREAAYLAELAPQPAP